MIQALLEYCVGMFKRKRETSYSYAEGKPVVEFQNSQLFFAYFSFLDILKLLLRSSAVGKTTQQIYKLTTRRCLAAL